MTSNFMKLDGHIININQIRHISVTKSFDVNYIVVRFDDAYLRIELNETNLNIIEHYTGLTLQEE